MATAILLQYLDRAEAAELQDKLATASIHCILKQHGPTRHLWGGRFNQIQVDRKDFEKAKVIADAFDATLRERRAAALKLATTQCPHCTATNISVRKKISLVDKIRYWGVTVMICGECHAEWYV